jgi:hypothetical protein
VQPSMRFWKRPLAFFDQTGLRPGEYQQACRGGRRQYRFAYQYFPSKGALVACCY